MNAMTMTWGELSSTSALTALTRREMNLVSGGWDWGEFAQSIFIGAVAGAVGGGVAGLVTGAIGGLAAGGAGAIPGALMGGLTGFIGGAISGGIGGGITYALGELL